MIGEVYWIKFLGSGVTMYRILVYGIGNIAQKMVRDGLKGIIIGWIQSVPNVDLFSGVKFYSLKEKL